MNPVPKRRILCVDDDVDTCNLIAAVLSDFEVIRAHTKSDGLFRALTGSLDLILLDHHLPDGTGLDLCKEIRERDPITPILFFTGTIEVSAKKFAEVGGQAMISKTEITRLLPAITLALFGQPQSKQPRFNGAQAVT